jgi:hypothetical protein
MVFIDHKSNTPVTQEKSASIRSSAHVVEKQQKIGSGWPFSIRFGSATDSITS